MKIIFLDFDGPLSNDRTLAQTGAWWSFDPVSAQVLNNICAYSGAKIVVSSTRASKHPVHFRETCKLMAEAGLDPKHLHEDWCIRDRNEYFKNGKPKSRTALIKEWLGRHHDVSHFVVVDDETVSLPNFVRVSRTDGILSRHFNLIARYLEIDQSELHDFSREVRGEAKGQYRLPFDNWADTYNRAVDKSFSL